MIDREGKKSETKSDIEYTLLHRRKKIERETERERER